MLLAEKVVIVSGVGPGLGRSIALACAREGARVVLSARNREYLDTVAAEIRAAGGEALVVAADITLRSDCDQLVRHTIEHYQRIDVLVNNAFRGGVEPRFEEVDLQRWREVFEVNVFGSLQLAQAVVPYMRAQHSGAIVFINSMSARVIEPGMGGYASSKGALLIAARTLAKELGPYGIRVNSVVPGYIWSEKLEGYFRWLARQQGRTFEEVRDDIAGRTALGHIPDSDEIADTVVFFASDLSRAVTGQALDVNAGHFFD
ncbi:MAG: putative Short-chain dehydrogenase/reductase [Candidatus Binatia bacterium]|nr:MAG: putative Short-chain dehydrogenase/reductase [Fimbriimonadales bacterium]GIW44204.1 MAG: putative Short-chain dehydrogenase/reductase [Candidatus Binatia bacterium]